MEIIISIIIAVLAAVWVFKDGKKRYPEKSSAPGYWALGTFLILIVFLPLYLIFRPKENKAAGDEKMRIKQQKQTEEKAIWKKWWFWAMVVFIIMLIVSAENEGEAPDLAAKKDAIVAVEEEKAEELPPEKALQIQYDVYKEWKDSSGTFQQVVIIPPELRNENDLFMICDELNEETKNHKSITVRGFTDKTAAYATMLIDESPQLLWQFSDAELKNINHHAVLAFDKSLLIPLKIFECGIYPQGFDYPGKTRKY